MLYFLYITREEKRERERLYKIFLYSIYLLFMFIIIYIIFFKRYLLILHIKFNDVRIIRMLLKLSEIQFDLYLNLFERFEKSWFAHLYNKISMIYFIWYSVFINFLIFLLIIQVTLKSGMQGDNRAAIILANETMVIVLICAFWARRNLVTVAPVPRVSNWLTNTHAPTDRSSCC